MTTQYLIYVQLPLLLDSLHWQPSYVYNIVKDYPELHRHEKLQAHIKHVEELKELDRREAAEAEARRKANFPTLEERQEEAKLKAQREANKQDFIRKLNEARSGVTSSNPYEGTVDHIEATW